MSVSCSAQSGGAHTHTSAPSARNRTASPGGSTSSETQTATKAHVPRESLISAGFWLRLEILHHDPGLAARPPVHYLFLIPPRRHRSFPLAELLT